MATFADALPSAISSRLPRLLRGGMLAAVIATGLAVGGMHDARAQAQTGETVTYGMPAVAPAEFNGDLSKLPLVPIGAAGPKFQLPRFPGPVPVVKMPTMGPQSAPQASSVPGASMPSPIQNFDGLSFRDLCGGVQCGTGFPPDTNGDVGPNHYILTVNGSVAIYNKTGTLLSSFTEDQLFATSGSNLCNGSSQGDPVALYDYIADRWVLTWFAFSASTGPFVQCIAASKTADPVAGGWWLYAVQTDTGSPIAAGYLNDYGKFGLWHDCLYMGTNEFQGFGAYKGVGIASFSRADMYAGLPLTYSLGFIPYIGPAPGPNNVFSMFPSSNLGQGSRAVQAGTPNYFVMESQTAFNYEVRKFTAGANCGAGGVLGAPVNVAQTSYTYKQGNVVPQPNTAITLDMIDDRIMQKVQYRKIGNTESVWVTHPVGTNVGNQIAMQWAQIDVTGGTVAATPVQQQIFSPDNTLYRFMGSLAVDKQGNMAMGYTTSNGTAPNFPSVVYAGRLASDPLNTLPQGETTMVAGGGSQNFNCGGAPCDRWGDYSSMSVDPVDGCTFWYATEYYDTQVNGNFPAVNWHTRIGSFKFPSCNTASASVVVSNNNPAALASAVTFTATITGSAPTGTVAFKDNGVTIGTCGAVALTGSIGAPTAQCTTSSLATGTHPITAVYSGDSTTVTSTSAPLSQVIGSGGGPSTTVVTTSLTPSLFGQSVTFTATVTGASPTGTVAFTSDGVTIAGCAAVPLVAGGSVWGGAGGPPTAKCITSTLPVGSHSIVGTYSGDGANASSFGTRAQVVSSAAPAATTTVVVSSNPHPAAGQSITFTASVTGNLPTGAVNFTANGAAIGGCSGVGLVGAGNTRTAQCTTSFARGTYSIVSQYSGDAANSPSNDSLSQRVR